MDGAWKGGVLTMKIAIVPDSFKGCLTSRQVAQYLAAGIYNVLPEIELQSFPLADGGEGTIDAVLSMVAGERYQKVVCGPCGQPVEAEFAMLQDGTAVLEVAQASGLPLVPEALRDPTLTTSYGTGELMLAAVKAGCKRILLGLGGSATNDGGAGILQACGGRLLDKHGNPLSLGGLALRHLARLDLSSLSPELLRCPITAMCDVSNPLCGETGASVIYGPQKGATSQQVAQLDQALAHYADMIYAYTGRDVVEIPGSGAAGGIGAGLLAFFQASLRPGVDLLLELIGFEEKIPDFDLIITGEGKIDASSAYGKAPLGVARLAQKYQVPVIAVGGQVGPGIEKLHSLGIKKIIRLSEPPLPLAESIAQAPALLIACGQAIAQHLRTGDLGAFFQRF